MTIRVVLADDHPVVREGVRALLESDSDFEVVGQADDGVEVAGLVERLHPDVVVLDLMMPGRGGLEVTRQLGRQPAAPPILILSMHDSEAYVIEAMQSGAAGYALKQAAAGELARGIRTVAAGERYLSPPLSDRALETYIRHSHGQSDPHDALTPRERRTEAPQGARAGLSIVIGRFLGTVVVTLRGTLDTLAATRLAATLQDLIEGQGNLAIALDLRGLRQVAPSGLRVLSAAASGL